MPGRVRAAGLLAGPLASAPAASLHPRAQVRAHGAHRRGRHGLRQGSVNQDAVRSARVHFNNRLYQWLSACSVGRGRRARAYRPRVPDTASCSAVGTTARSAAPSAGRFSRTVASESSPRNRACRTMERERPIDQAPRSRSQRRAREAHRPGSAGSGWERCGPPMARAPGAPGSSGTGRRRRYLEAPTRAAPRATGRRGAPVINGKVHEGRYQTRGALPGDPAIARYANPRSVLRVHAVSERGRRTGADSVSELRGERSDRARRAHAPKRLRLARQAHPRAMGWELGRNGAGAPASRRAAARTGGHSSQRRPTLGASAHLQVEVVRRVGTPPRQVGVSRGSQAARTTHPSTRATRAVVVHASALAAESQSIRYGHSGIAAPRATLAGGRVEVAPHARGIIRREAAARGPVARHRYKVGTRG